MPETLSCPECQRKVRLPDHLLGKRVKCPGCGGTFMATVPAPANTAPVPAELETEPFEAVQGRPRDQEPEDDLDFPRDTGADIPAADVSAWFGVRAGVKLQALSHVVLAGGATLLLLLSLISLASSSLGDNTFMKLLAGLSNLAMQGAWILAVVAGCFLLGTPPRRSARGLALGMLVMSALVVLEMTSGIHSSPAGSGRGGAPFGAGIIPAYLAEIARLTVLALLLRAMCLNLGQGGLGTRAQLVALLTACIMPGVFVLTLLIFGVVTSLSETVVVLFLVLNLGSWIGMLVFGGIVMLGLAQKLDRKLPRNEPD